MPDSLYDRDILVWCDQQAEQLRRLAAGERPNAPIDWENVIEELESVGRSELRSCASLLRQAIVHLMKLAIWPDKSSAEHWRDETYVFLRDTQQAFTPSMRERLDLAREYRAAMIELNRKSEHGRVGPWLPQTCPYTLDDLLDPDLTVEALVVRLGTAGSAGQ
ncbi:MAG: DUF29 domain-containing protein [Gemmatimonadaceae bacterium]|nr:DUF29 domain-containing protein [Acetobacteraceae bacterium]